MDFFCQAQKTLVPSLKAELITPKNLFIVDTPYIQNGEPCHLPKISNNNNGKAPEIIFMAFCNLYLKLNDKILKKKCNNTEFLIS